ncbi:hypothetical protein EDB83DRAFT_2400289 [Lactarius deliciosus]|nr:hypothetical protein EDB83DRAFT_2400289 [Lactarius deliciosus]
MDFSKSIYWRGCPPFTRTASPWLRFTSFTTPSLSHSPLRTRAPMCLPFRSCVAPPPGMRSALPTHPSCNSSACGLRSGCIVPRTAYPLRVRACSPPPCTHLFSGAAWGWAGRTDPLASPGVRGHGGVHKRRAGVARAEGVDVLTLPLRVNALSLLLQMWAGRVGLGRCHPC